MLSEHIGMHQMLTLEYFEFIFFITQRTGLSKYAKKFVKSNKSTITISKKKCYFLKIFFVKIKLLDQKIERIFSIHLILLVFWPRPEEKFPCNFSCFFNRLRRSFSGTAKLNYTLDKKVYVVLEEDGTEVDEEEYFQTLPSNTLLMLLYVGDRWSPYGAPFT